MHWENREEINERGQDKHERRDRMIRDLGLQIQYSANREP